MRKEREDSYGHVLKYTGIFGGVQGLNMFIGIVRNKIVASLLGPAGMGLASLFNSVVSFISQATNLGISFSAVRHVSELFDSGDEERIRHFVKVVRAWSLLTALIGMLLCIVAGPLLSSYSFSWGNHTLHFILLSPAVAMMAITGGETAILKGARRLRSLALIQVCNVFIALLICIPIYYYYGQRGIVPVILLMALAMMLLTVHHSFRLYPLDLFGARGVLGEGMEMLRLGVAFVMAGVLNSGADMLIRSYLNVVGDLDTVGLYNAGFVLTTTYAGLVFSTLETEYFPRLSAIAADPLKTIDTVNRQIEVTLLIVAPMLTMLIIGLPVIVPLLFTSEFTPVVSMSQVVLLSMFLRAVYLPIGYITLAKGDSLQFFFLEGIYDVLIVLLVVWGFSSWGLFGTGVALALANVSDVVIMLLYAHARYRYRLSGTVVRYLFIHLFIGSLAYLLTFVSDPLVYWPLGLLVCGLSLAVSLYILHTKTSLWKALSERVSRRLNTHNHDKGL